VQEGAVEPGQPVGICHSRGLLQPQEYVTDHTQFTGIWA
jgi:hypothetical protein